MGFGPPQGVVDALIDISAVNFSAGTTSSNLAAVVFSNSGGVSFGINASTITATVATNYVPLANSTNFAGVGETVGTVAGTDIAITMDTAGLSLLYPKAITTAMISGASTQFVQAAAVFNGTNCSGTIASNSFSVSVGAYITTAALSNVTQSFGTASYYCNIDNYNGMVTGASAVTQTSGSSIFVQPFMLPQAISLSYVRFLASFNDTAVGTAGTTQDNTTYSAANYTTYALVVYSQGAGASSRSIQSIGSTSVGMTGVTIYSGGTAGSRYSITVQKTYPDAGATTNVYTSSYAVSSASIVISSGSNTLFTGPRYLDLAWATSFSAGNYWIGLGASRSSASNSANISFAGTAILPISIAGISQSNVSFGRLGNATSASDHQLQIGLGVWTTNASGFSTASIGIGEVSQVASNPQVPFQMVRQA
jgi:hypothetical protein